MSESPGHKLGDNLPAGEPILPGDVLKTEYLDPHGLSAHDVDAGLDLPDGTTLSIVEGRRRITGWMSQLLGRPFGLPEGYFLGLQRKFDDDEAAVDEEEEHESAHRLDMADAMAGKLGLHHERFGGETKERRESRLAFQAQVEDVEAADDDWAQDLLPDGKMP